MAKIENVELTLHFDADGVMRAIAEFVAALEPVAQQMAKAEKAFAAALERAFQEEGYVD